MIHMTENDDVGRIISGEFGEIYVRQRKEKVIEMGDLLVSDTDQGLMILQVTDLLYGSQLPEKVRTLIAGMKNEGHGIGLDFMDPGLNNFILAEMKNLVLVRNERVQSPKTLPGFFSSVRSICESDLSFIGMPDNPLHVGSVRSGSKVLDVNVVLDGEKTLKHHVLIPASTGKGKSNLVKVMSYSALDKNYCGMLILDPHNEYFGSRSDAGLSHHPRATQYLHYYTMQHPPPGQSTMVIHINQLRPWHLGEVMNLSEAQYEAVFVYYHDFGPDWIQQIMQGITVDTVHEATLAALQRKINVYLSIYYENEALTCRSIFRNDHGETTINAICDRIEQGHTVLIDTSTMDNRTEILVGAIISQQLLDRYKRYKNNGTLNEKPVVSIVIEEAPRVLGTNSLIKSGNVYETIAREGRKFKIGLIAITQLPSVIPREILANMNTKIILGTEMSSDRKAIIESASQDLSKDDRNIASLDIGEGLITSTFTKFAVPISIPLFDDIIQQDREKDEKSDKNERQVRKYAGFAEQKNKEGKKI